MTSSQRISTPLATPSVAPVSTPKAAPAGADDFATTLTQARGSRSTPSASNTPSTRSGATADAAAARESQTESTTAASTPKSTKGSRTQRDPKETEDSGARDDAASSTGQLPADVAAALNGVAIPPTTAPLVSPEGEAAAEAAAATRNDAALADIAQTASGGTVVARREPRASVPTAEASALAGALVAGQNVAPSGVARVEPASLPAGRLAAASSELPPSAARGADRATIQTADPTAFVAITDALQAATVANARNADASGAGASLPQNATPDSAVLSQLTSTLAANEPASLTRNAHTIPQYPVHAGVGAHGWNDELATRLTWMVDQHQHAATLRLSPENMGPVEVRIDVRDNQVSVWFGAAQADTRAAIESALPRLRELLQGQGLSLADAGVSQQSQRESSRPTSTPQGAMFGETDGANEMSVAVRVGLFDGYA